MEAARIPWRPLGRILVEQGLLTSEELETALEQQERTGKRLGETIVECGFVSGPELSSALASQYGIELTTETGFGTGLRGQIQRRHESERRSARPTLVEAASLGAGVDHADEVLDEVPETTQAEAGLLVQLEEQWAKLAAAEARLAEQEQELATAARQHDRRRQQAIRFARAARAHTPAPAVHDDGLRDQCARLEADLRARDEELDRLKQDNAHAHDRRAALEQSLADSQAELAHARAELAGAHEAIVSAQAAIADQERRHHELGSEFERVVHARAEVEQSLASVSADLDQRNHRLDELQEELAQAHGAVVAAETAMGDQNRRLDELAAELERVVDSRPAIEQELADVIGQRDRRREQAGRLARRARSRAATGDNHDEQNRTVDRLQGELAEAHDAIAATVTAIGDQNQRLDELAAELDERNRRIEEVGAELAQAHGAVAAAENAIGDQNRRVEELAAELERVVHSRAALERELGHLSVQHDRRRQQAERLARRARARIVASETAEAAALEHDDLRPQVDELRRQIDDLSAEARSRQAELEHLRAERTHAHERLASLEQSLSARDAELTNAREALGSLAATQTAVEEREHAMHELARKLDRQRAQAVRLTSRLRLLRQVDDQQLSQIERLVADVRGCDAEITRLRSENERARAQTMRFLARLRRARELAVSHREPEAEPVGFTSHLVFVQLHDRYELVERPGPPPPRHTPVALPDVDANLVVAGSRRSPLPNDARPCVVAESSLVFTGE